MLTIPEWVVILMAIWFGAITGPTSGILMFCTGTRVGGWVFRNVGTLMFLACLPWTVLGFYALKIP
jgi:hypothetical protein